jgi:predicted Zn-dependent protease
LSFLKKTIEMKRIMTFLAVAFLMVGCTRNAVTGRKQLQLYPESEITAAASQQYQQFLSENKVVSPNSSRDAEMVRRVGQRIANAITQYYTKQGLAKELSGYQWEYNLVDSKEVNAWCMPGGKIVVYTGLLPITQNEAALGVVIGHEVTHAVAKHGNERLSQGMLQQLGGVALSAALSSQPTETQNLMMAAYGAGSEVGILLPYSRNQEYEADKFGLFYAAMAGYNPQEAIPLWQRMEAAAQGSSKPPEFLSTHPAEGNRIKRLQDLMPEALKYYKPVH